MFLLHEGSQGNLYEEQTSGQSHHHVNFPQHDIYRLWNIEPESRECSDGLTQDVDKIEDGQLAEENIEGSLVGVLLLPDIQQEG